MTAGEPELLVTLEQAIGEVFDQIDQRKAGRGTPLLGTGFEPLDEIIGGFRPGALYVLAARPAVGKTALAMNFALNVIAHVPTLFFSMEMASHELGARAVAIRAGVPLHAITGTRPLKPDEAKRLAASGLPTTKGTLWIDDRSHLSPDEVARKAREAQDRHGVKLIVIDYLQRMKHDRRAGDTVSAHVGASAKSLKTLARDLGVPVVCLAQLSRAIEKRGDAKPVLSDLRDSGEIEQEADVVMLLHPESPPADGERSRTERITVFIAKQRNGRTEEVTLDYVRPYTQFRAPVPSM